MTDLSGVQSTPIQRLAAKRFNERLKLSANAFNALAIAAVATSLLIPAINGGIGRLSIDGVIWFLLGIVLHLIAQMTLSLLRREDSPC